MALSIEEHVEKYWDVIDNHSLDNALMVTSKRHSETKELLDALEYDVSVTNYQSELMITMLDEVRERYEYEQSWREKIKQRLNKC